MNKKIVVAVVILLLILGGGYVWSQSRNTAPETPQESEKSDSLIGKKESTLKNLLSSGESVKCEYTDGDSGGSVYLANKKMRGDFVYADAKDGKRMFSHMISDSELAYIWVDGESKGFKMSVVKPEPTNADANPSVGFDLDKNYSYDCQTWKADPNAFNLPTGVEFTDMSAMMNSIKSIGSPATNTGGSGTNTGNIQNLAAMCDQLPAEAKAECLSAFKK